MNHKTSTCPCEITTGGLWRRPCSCSIIHRPWSRSIGLVSAWHYNDNHVSAVQLLGETCLYLQIKTWAGIEILHVIYIWICCFFSFNSLFKAALINICTKDCVWRDGRAWDYHHSSAVLFSLFQLIALFMFWLALADITWLKMQRADVFGEKSCDGPNASVLPAPKWQTHKSITYLVTIVERLAANETHFFYREEWLLDPLGRQ